MFYGACDGASTAPNLYTRAKPSATRCCLLSNVAYVERPLLADFCLSLPAAIGCELPVEFECNGSWTSSRLFSSPFLQLVLNEPHFCFDRRDGELLHRAFSGSGIHQLEHSNQVGFSRFQIFENL